MTNLEAAKKYEPYIIAMRRYFHENPELSNCELETLKKIGEELDAMGIPYVEIPKGGILAKITGEKDNGRAVLLRADVDALPVQEPENNVCKHRTCISKNDGVMHACGHDAHMAMLLGAAKVLLDKKEEIEGTVYLCFERGEEGTGNVSYIIAYLENEKIHLDSSYAMHVYTSLESGKIAINDGRMMACTFAFDVTIQGKGGHGSRPDQAISPIDAFHSIYSQMQNFRMTHISPYEPVTFSVGKVVSGEVRNVIPESLTFAGTVRTFDPDGAGQIFMDGFRKIIDSTCAIYDCKPIYHNFAIPGLPLINDTECAQMARQVIAQEWGEDDVVQMEPWIGTESFSRLQMLCPGVFAFLGIRDEEKGTTAAHHNPYFDVDESVLYKGAASAVTYALAFLQSDIDTSERKAKGGYAAFLQKKGRWGLLRELYQIEKKNDESEV